MSNEGAGRLAICRTPGLFCAGGVSLSVAGMMNDRLACFVKLVKPDIRVGNTIIFSRSQNPMEALPTGCSSSTAGRMRNPLKLKHSWCMRILINVESVQGSRIRGRFCLMRADRRHSGHNRDRNNRWYYSDFLPILLDRTP